VEHSPVVITGASGFVGTALCASLEAAGREVRRLSLRGEVDPAALDGAAAVVNLAGENIGKRWTKTRKQAIRESRIAGTERLVAAIARAKRPPSVLVSASAVGFYGMRASGPVDESAPAGDDFLAEVCRDWEAAANRASGRVVNTRFGVVLSPKGGALAKMLPAFRLGAGGRIGDGTQPMSWVALDDVIAAIRFALETPSLSGPVNVTAPGAATNAEFTRALGKALHRPAVLPLPSALVKLAFGEMGESALLSGVIAVPAKLERAGFRFGYPTLEAALGALFTARSAS
jgi:uncharacterized protein (TIGR01777 family)